MRRLEISKAPLDIPAEVTTASLQPCDCKLPVAGLLYFPYRGKLKAIKSMVLRYAPPGGEAVDLKLQP